MQCHVDEHPETFWPRHATIGTPRYMQAAVNTSRQHKARVHVCNAYRMVKVTAKASASHKRSVLVAAAAAAAAEAAEASLTQTPGFWAQTSPTETRSAVGTAGPTEACLL